MPFKAMEDVGFSSECEGKSLDGSSRTLRTSFRREGVEVRKTDV